MALDKFQPYLFVSAGEQSNKYLTPTITNGIAQFQAQRAQSLTGLTVRIDAIQEGTGDPSPSNIRPISGRTGLTVTAAGKNLLNPSLTSGLLSITIGALETDITPSGRYAYTERFPSIEDVILSIKSSEVARCEYAKIVQYVDGVVVAVATNVNMADTTTWHTKVMPGRPNSYCRLVIGGTNLSPGEYIHGDAQVEVGSTATPYTPYVAPTTYPITWQTEAGTIYGGTLDVVSGVLTVDRAIVDMGTLNYTYDSSGGRFYTSVSGKKNEASDSDMMLAISSMYKPMTATAFQSNPTNGTMRGATVGGYCYFRNDAYTDAASFKTAMAGQTLCYVVATPQTYQLTPTDVKTLAGYNQIYSDAGPVIDIQF